MGFLLKNGESVTLNKAIEAIAMQKIKTFPIKIGNGVGWIISSDELKKALNINQDIYVSFSYGGKYLLEKIIGFSYEDWTPMVLLLKEETEDGKINSVTNFLYMKGGFALRGWQWVNSGIYGPNLWPDARKFLLAEVIKNT